MLIDLALFCFSYVLFSFLRELSILYLDRTLLYYFVILFQSNDVTPPCRGVLASEIVLDGICKDIRFPLLFFLSVLLGSKDYGLGPIDLVYPVNHLVQRLQLLKSFSVYVKKI